MERCAAVAGLSGMRGVDVDASGNVPVKQTDTLAYRDQGLLCTSSFPSGG